MTYTSGHAAELNTRRRQNNAMADRYQNDRNQLRDALDLHGVNSIEHRQKIEEIGRVSPHTVVYREFVPESTCVTYALNLSGDVAYRAIAGNFDGKIFAGKQFIVWLLQSHLQEINHAKRGSLALYFAETIWKHIGVVSGSARLISKWGTFPVYEHGLFEVPTPYGDIVRYFNSPCSGQPRQLFLQYAQTCGLSKTDINAAIQSSV
jgi:hypothetical protein